MRWEPFFKEFKPELQEMIVKMGNSNKSSAFLVAEYLDLNAKFYSERQGG